MISTLLLIAALLIFIRAYRKHGLIRGVFIGGVQTAGLALAITLGVFGLFLIALAIIAPLLANAV